MSHVVPYVIEYIRENANINSVGGLWSYAKTWLYHHRYMNVWMTKWSGEAWVFEFSSDMREIQDAIYELAELLPDSPQRAETGLRKILDNESHAFDAYYHLSYILFWKHRIHDAINLLEKGFTCAQELFPSGFVLGKSHLPWGILENRPFLRMYEALGESYLDDGRTDAATKVFEYIVGSNPDDNQGIREDLVKCYFDKGNTSSIIKLCNKYSRDTLPAIMYGKVLALLREAKIQKAKDALDFAIRYGENIAREVVKRKHTFIDSEEPGYVVVGSKHEGYLYWEQFGKYWTKTPDAIEFVRKALNKSRTLC